MQAVEMFDSHLVTLPRLQDKTDRQHQTNSVGLQQSTQYASQSGSALSGASEFNSLMERDTGSGGGICLSHNALEQQLSLLPEWYVHHACFDRIDEEEEAREKILYARCAEEEAAASDYNSETAGAPAQGEAARLASQQLAYKKHYFPHQHGSGQTTPMLSAGIKINKKTMLVANEDDDD
jgi:hypothetical protein